jgi:NAD(P)H-dependent FMN reductase
VAKWFMNKTKEFEGDIDFELVDLAKVNLPFMDEPAPAMAGNEYVHQHTRDWSKLINEADGFVFITPEYNHGYSPALKNAVDFLYHEWKDKPAAMIGYGSAGATHSIRQFREILEFVGVRPLADQVGIIQIWEAFDEQGHLKDEKIQGDVVALIRSLKDELSSDSASSAA